MFNRFQFSVFLLMTLYEIKPVSLAPSSTEIQQRVLLMSFDGFRYDYIERYNMENFMLISNMSARASYMKPQFTTQTFPNHWSMVTGLYEENHGIIANSFYDPLYNESFTRSNTNLKFWNATEPIWYTAVRNNISVGVHAWPGSAVKFMNSSLYENVLFNPSITTRQRIDTAIDWFINKNRTFVALYDLQPDTDGHLYGIDSAQFNATIARIDDDIAYLIQRLNETGLLTSPDFNVIIVSDHGMSNTQKVVVLDNYTNLQEVSVWASGGNIIHLQPNSSINESVLLEKLRTMPNVTVFHKEDIPDYWHFKNNRRIGDIIIVADEYISLNSYIEKPSASRTTQIGDHGYDNNLVNMRAFFMGFGVLFKQGYKSKNYILNTDVYPLLCHMMNFECLPNNGSLDRVMEYLVGSAIDCFANKLLIYSLIAFTTIKALF